MDKDKELVQLTIDEIKLIYGIIEHHYISYENIEAINLIRRFRRIIQDSKELNREGD